MENLSPFVLILLLTGGTFLLAGFIQHKFPPKKINHFYGYRTTASMRSQAHWNFAQTHSAQKMIQFSLAMIAIAGLSWGLDFAPPYPLVFGLLLTLIFPVMMILDVEKELKKRFPKDL